MLQAKPSRWRKLDNAAKIFPATSGKRDTRVFRFSCELKEEIDEKLLQEALDLTMKGYPMFRSVLRKGFFWYYLEKSDLVPAVKLESRQPCSDLYIRDKKSLLFEVTYYQRRINFEVYHALTDGTGAMQFLKELVRHYLMCAHPLDLKDKVPLADSNITTHDKEDDSFAKYYSEGDPQEKKKKLPSFQIRGARTEPGIMQITEGVVSSKQLVETARRHGVSVTVFLTSVFLCAIHEEMSPRKERYPVVLMVPVNLRKYFPSESMLNFFGWIEPGYRFQTGNTTLEDVLQHVKAFFQEQLTKDRVSAHMNSLMKLEKNPLLRIVPLELKNIFIQAGAKLSEKNVTAILSNMGVVDMPEPYCRYIEMFHVFTSTPKMEMCMCSFKDHMVMSFTSRFENMNIQRNYFRMLEELGVDVRMKKTEYPKQERPAYVGLRFFQWFSFLCIALAVLAAMANVILTPEGRWAYVVSGGILSMWLALAVGFYKRRNLLKNAVWQEALVIIASIAWDLFTGWRGWSIDYVFPGIVLLTIASMIVITLVQHLKAKDYMVYYFMTAILGLVPLLLLVAGSVAVSYPSVICGGISFLFLVSLAIFRRKAFVTELVKKLHI